VYNFAAEKYTACCFKLSEIYGLAHWYDGDDAEDKAQQIKDIRTGLKDLSEMVKRMGLGCVEMVDRISEKIDESTNSKHATDLLDEVQKAVLGSFKGRSCWIMTVEETKLFEYSPTEIIGEKFPQSAVHLIEAAECLALGKAEASVFPCHERS
jgi:hypothetical protein